MTKVIVTAKVKDPEAWEAGFRSMGVTLSNIFVSPIHLGMRTDDNSFAYVAEVKDLGHFLSIIKSEKIQKVQKENGVIDGTVRYYVLDKHIDF